MVLQVSSVSTKVAGTHRLAGLSQIRGLHERQETLHRLGVPREDKFDVTDIVFASSPCIVRRRRHEASTRFVRFRGGVLKDDNGEWRLGHLGKGLIDIHHEGSKRRLEKKNENGEWGNWCSGPGPKGKQWNGAAKVNAHFILKVNGVVCWGNYHEGTIKTAMANKRGGYGEKVVRKEDLPIGIREMLKR